MANIDKNVKDDGSSAKDKLFDPPVEMMIHDYDDERTLDEEEALAANDSDDPNDEVSTLKKESDMPLPEVLAGYYKPKTENQQEKSPEEQQEKSPEEQQEKSREELEEAVIDDDESDTEPQASSKLKTLCGSKRSRRSSSRAGDEEEEDCELLSSDDDSRKFKKIIMVGPKYQAPIPSGLCHYDDALPYENEDKLLWNPHDLEDSSVDAFLEKAALLSRPTIPVGTQLRDDEQALFLLQQCGYNSEEALRRLGMNAVPDPGSITLWSEEECRNFETGFKTYGKSFQLIQQNKVRTRSVGELVQFYYLWKKSERHDIFANKIRLEKKKYTLHPGLTDFMDRFLEDHDGHDRSSSPSIHFCYLEPKKENVQDIEKDNSIRYNI